MRHSLEAFYHISFLSFGEHSDGGVLFSCLTASGRLVVADSLPLILAELEGELDARASVQLPLAA